MRTHWIVNFAFLFTFYAVIAICLPALGDESVGRLKLETLVLRANLSTDENRRTHFDLEDSLFGLSWERDSHLSAYMAVGSEKSVNLPIYYQEPVEDRLGFIQAYAQYKDYYGYFRFGLIPLNFGYDGSLLEQDRYFDRSLFFTERVIGLSDQGVSFYTENRGYYTQLALHNGEVNTKHDGRLWATGLWGFTNDRAFRVQFSLQTGSVDGDLSFGATNPLAGVANGEAARWRNGLLFFNWYPKKWNIVLEAGGGELDQNMDVSRYMTTLFELSRQVTKNFRVGARYNELDPNHNNHGDKLTDISALLAYQSDDATSSLILVGTKSLEEANELNDDKIRLVWLLTPFAR